MNTRFLARSVSVLMAVVSISALSACGSSSNDQKTPTVNSVQSSQQSTIQEGRTFLANYMRAYMSLDTATICTKGTSLLTVKPDGNLGPLPQGLKEKLAAEGVTCSKDTPIARTPEKAAEIKKAKSLLPGIIKQIETNPAELSQDGKVLTVKNVTLVDPTSGEKTVSNMRALYVDGMWYQDLSATANSSN